MPKRLFFRSLFSLLIVQQVLLFALLWAILLCLHWGHATKGLKDFNEIFADGAALTWFIRIVTIWTLLFVYLCFCSGRRAFGRRLTASPSPLPVNFFRRYAPVVFTCVWVLVAELATVYITNYYSKSIAIFPPPFGYPFAFFWVAFLDLLGSPHIVWIVLGSTLLSCAAYAFGMSWQFRSLAAPPTGKVSWIVFCSALMILGLVLLQLRLNYLNPEVVRLSDQEVGDSVLALSYDPWNENNKLVSIAAPTLTIENEHPRLRGALALYPVYAAAARAIYRNLPTDDRYGKMHVWTGVLGVGSTPDAYISLLNGYADIIFALAPSPEQAAEAKAKGVEYQLTPLGREAFVFFVNAVNPVNGLTNEQIRQIYTKKITNWRQVGGQSGEILPFQRNANSGSQTTMERLVMRGDALPPPLMEERGGDMGGIVRRAASYRNAKTAIGYSFRFFVQQMTAAKEVKLLAIDGIAPTKENILNGSYSYVTEFYAITTDKTADKSHVRELIQWFQSEQGQKLIEDSGYVPLK